MTMSALIRSATAGLVVALTAILPAMEIGSNDATMGGSNSWILHTPDDGRSQLLIALGVNGGSWDWERQIMLRRDGWLQTYYGYYANSRMHLAAPNEDIYLLPKGGVIVSGAWGGQAALTVDGETRLNRNLNLTGNLQFPGASTINAGGRLHVSGGELLYLLNKSGVIVSKAWGGNGNLNVEGLLRAAEIRTAKVTVNANVWADHVLAPEYRLAPLGEVKAAIAARGHLPGIPSQAELERDGIDTADMLARHMGKIEELTLHAIRQEEVIERQRGEIAGQRQVIAAQQAESAALQARLERLERHLGLGR